ncbi:MAG: ribulokinase [Clostridiaceae bacterium]|jgi:L-ribulokinase|nr:ribulokinase [Clostridiaceae bacterium]
MERRLALGIDFGSLSGRAMLVDLATGAEAGLVVCPYQHGFIEDVLPASGAKLPPDWTLQDPADYLAVLAAVPDLLTQARADASEVVGVGIDFTASTVLPVRADGTPLSFLPAFRTHPHAYVKVWKHHAAQMYANRINELARSRGETFLSRYGGRVSSEWLLPKLMQILEEAPEVYAAMDRLVEATDWIVQQLTGQEKRSSCAAGYKALWNKREGYPAPGFFGELDGRLADVVTTKLSPHVFPVGSRAGTITAAAASLTGLLPGTPVAVGNVDAHVTFPAAGLTRPGQLLMILGTSTCHLLLGEEEKAIPGICGAVEDGILPGYWGYEAGQPCVGDLFDWFVHTQVPPSYHEEAANRACSIHQVLREKAMRLGPGESGLVALDWWNGNRSVLADADLSGLLLGMTLTTRPEAIYRALIEATAFGSRLIVGQFEAGGLPVHDIHACGGIAARDPFLMQIYADVLGRPIRVSANRQAAALGSALYGAVAAGPGRGGFPDIEAAVNSVPQVPGTVYEPDLSHRGVYEQLFACYSQLHDWFGRGGHDIMKRLKALRLEASLP